VQDGELRDFIMLCIQHDSTSRPEARQLLKHPFFRSLRDSLPCNASAKELAERPLPELQVRGVGGGWVGGGGLEVARVGGGMLEVGG
jgi:hypothetical protein